jgi:hypothetical protein
MDATRTIRVAAALLVGCAAFFGIERIGTAVAQSSSAAYYRGMFHVNARDVSGLPTGVVRIGGGGSYDWDTGFIRGSGPFACVASVEQGPLRGCLEGQGIRWEATDLLYSAVYSCTDILGDPSRVAATGPESLVLLASFYRKGDGRVESFRAKMIMSTEDLDPDLPGEQHVWIEGVGCGS